MTASAQTALAAHRRRQAEEKLSADAGQYDDQGLIFANRDGGPLDMARLRKRFKVLAKMPGMRMYDLRHSHATLMLENGEHLKGVSERLGHSSITLTADTYSHVLPGMQQAATDRMEKLLG